jgi:hypothetical protein
MAGESDHTNKPLPLEGLGDMAEGIHGIEAETNPGAIVLNTIGAVVKLPFDLIGGIFTPHGSDVTPPPKTTSTVNHSVNPVPKGKGH